MNFNTNEMENILNKTQFKKNEGYNCRDFANETNLFSELKSRFFNLRMFVAIVATILVFFCYLKLFPKKR